MNTLQNYKNGVLAKMKNRRIFAEVIDGYIALSIIKLYPEKIEPQQHTRVVKDRIHVTEFTLTREAAEMMYFTLKEILKRQDLTSHDK